MKKLTNTLFVFFLMAGISVNAQNTKTKSATAIKANNTSKANAAKATMVDPADSEAVQHKKADNTINRKDKVKAIKKVNATTIKAKPTLDPKATKKDSPK